MSKAVRAMDSTSDPRHPSQLLKNKNKSTPS